MKFLHGLAVFLSIMLILVPPGGSVCWPLPGGRHVHIGWSNSEGEETLDLTVFAHATSESVGDPHAPSFAPASASELSVVGGVILPQSLSWFLPLITLVWVFLGQAAFPSAWRLPPATPPPRYVPSLIRLSHSSHYLAQEVYDGSHYPARPKRAGSV